MKKYYIIGGGIAGLSKAFFLLNKGIKGENIHIFESSSHLGGRCFSFYDKKLDRIIDIGTHLIIGANKNTISLLKKIKSWHSFEKIKPFGFPVFDIKQNEGFIIKDNLKSIKKFKNENLQNLLCESIFNVSKSEILPRYFWKNILRAGYLGRFSAQPYLAKNSLYEDLIEPLVNLLKNKGVKINLGHKLKEVRIEENRIKSLKFDSKIRIENNEVIFAVPLDNLAELIPVLKEELECEFSPIINIHFRTSMRVSLPNEVKMMGVINGFCHWLFVKDDVLSVTISDAEQYMDRSEEEIAREAWEEVCKIRGRVAPFLPNYRVIKSKKATVKKVNINKNRYNIYDNMQVIGDWMVEDYPNSIEAAIRSAKKIS